MLLHHISYSQFSIWQCSFCIGGKWIEEIFDVKIGEQIEAPPSCTYSSVLSMLKEVSVMQRHFLLKKQLWQQWTVTWPCLLEGFLTCKFKVKRQCWQILPRVLFTYSLWDRIYIVFHEKQVFSLKHKNLISFTPLTIKLLHLTLKN